MRDPGGVGVGAPMQEELGRAGRAAQERGPRAPTPALAVFWPSMVVAFGSVSCLYNGSWMAGWVAKSGRRGRARAWAGNGLNWTGTPNGAYLGPVYSAPWSLGFLT